ncbi:MAG: YHS domain-containing protein [Nitrospinales bacterium]
MYRLVVFAILLIVVILAVRAIVAPRSKEEDNDTESKDMVEDPNCHVFIPKAEAMRKEIQGKEQFFCSEKCAEEYQNFTRKN